MTLDRIVWKMWIEENKSKSQICEELKITKTEFKKITKL